ncbi:MAG TPA: FHA domain-containing protein, partial [Myxococcaceae bacterium]|nr:FHA domain-containing protein [Myxococcaceae bacterium]
MAPRRPPLGGNPNTAIQQQEKRRGGGPPPPDDDRDPEDAPSASSRGYRTGNDYPAQDDESLVRPSGEQPDLGDRDIYGEDDPLPDDPDQPVASDQVDPENDNPDATRAGPPRKLVVLAGPDKGKVKRFNGVRLVVGRTSSCNVHLSDNSVSRRHLELVQGGNSVLLRDLGSGNGTKVNGERVNERVLKHEDVIEIGQTKLQYVDEAEAIRLMREEAERREEEEKRKKEEEEARKKAEEEAAAQAAAEAAANPPPAEEAKPEGESDDEDEDEAPGKPRGKGGLDWRQKAGLGVAGGAVLFVLFILLPQLFAPKGPPPPEPKQVLAAKKLEQARTAIVEERYEDALGLAETAERMWPGIDADGFAAEARNELAAIKALGQARSFLDQQRFEDCRLALAQAPETSPRRVEEKQKLQAEL